MANLGNFQKRSPGQFTPFSQLNPLTIFANTNPGVNTVNYEEGTIWINQASSPNSVWILTSYLVGAAQWQQLAANGGSGSFTSLTVNPGPINFTGVFTQLGTVNMNVSGTAATNIGTGTNTGTVTIGNTVGTQATHVLAGSGNLFLDGAVGTNIDIGDTLTTGNINIGDAQTTGTMVIGGLGAASGLVSIAMGTGNQQVDIAANVTGNKTVIIGSKTGTSVSNILGGTGGIVIDATGLTQVVPATGAVAFPASTVTLNARVGVITCTGFTTANAGGVQLITLTDNRVLTTSFVQVCASNLNTSGNGALISILGVKQSANTLAITFVNNGAAALGAGDNVLLSFTINS